MRCTVKVFPASVEAGRTPQFETFEVSIDANSTVDSVSRLAGVPLTGTNFRSELNDVQAALTDKVEDGDELSIFKQMRIELGNQPGRLYVASIPFGTSIRGIFSWVNTHYGASLAVETGSELRIGGNIVNMDTVPSNHDTVAIVRQSKGNNA